MSMYVPRSNAIDDEQEIRGMVADVGTAQLITVGARRLPAGDAAAGPLGGRHRHRPHGARQRPLEADRPDAPALLVVTGSQAYVSPSWYPSKAEHGKVVPTWNYSVVQLSGRVRVHEDAGWLRTAVDTLTERHEAGRSAPWSSADAPEQYIHGQLRAIVGIEIAVERVDAKAKLSQNRSDADREGVVAGLRQEPSAGALAVADQMSWPGRVEGR